MRDVTVDEIFTWKDDLALKAKEAFGGHHAYANEQTYGVIRSRCSENPATWPNWLQNIKPINSFQIHIDNSVPDGILRGKDLERLP
jgi:hypothetical protein